MKYAVEIESDAMIHIPSFIMTGSDSQQLIGGHTATRTAGDLISLHFVKIRKVG
jgi:hypothetical protein